MNCHSIFIHVLHLQEEDIALLTPDKLPKADVKTCSRPVPDVAKKVRIQTKASSDSNRYKVRIFRHVPSKICCLKPFNNCYISVCYIARELLPHIK